MNSYLCNSILNNYRYGQKSVNWSIQLGHPHPVQSTPLTVTKSGLFRKGTANFMEII